MYTDFKNVLKLKTQVFQMGAKNKSGLIILDTEAEHVNSYQYFLKKIMCVGNIKQMGAKICKERTTSTSGTVFLISYCCLSDFQAYCFPHFGTSLFCKKDKLAFPYCLTCMRLSNQASQITRNLSKAGSSVNFIT